jgi:hypothetical protein
MKRLNRIRSPVHNSAASERECLRIRGATVLSHGEFGAAVKPNSELRRLFSEPRGQ